MDSEDKLDEDFMYYLSFAEQYWGSVQAKRDKDLCQEWLYKLTSLQKTRAEKRNRNVYLSQLGLAMADGEMSGPFLRLPPEGALPSSSDVFGPPQPQIEVPTQFRKLDKTKDLNTTHISKDGRTYVATKSLGKGHGAYTYIGISLAEDEPRWVGGDSTTLPCQGFDHHFQKAHVFYSKASPRYPSTIFSVEQSPCTGDKVEHTQPFTDYVAFAEEPKMSGTHIPDFSSARPSQRTEEKASTPAPEVAPPENRERKSTVIAEKTVEPVPLPETTKETPSPKPSIQPKEPLKSSEKPVTFTRKKPIVICVPEDYEELPPCSCGLQQIPFQRTHKTAAPSSDIEGDLAGFYTAMINNANNTMKGREQLNEFNTEKADEIDEAMQNKINDAELLNILKENLILKLQRVRKEEMRIVEFVRDVQVSMLYTTTESDDVIFENSLKLVCESHNETKLEYLEQHYNAGVKDRMSTLMTRAKKDAVKSKTKEIRRQTSSAREDMKDEIEKLQTRKKIAKDYLKKVNKVLDEIEDVVDAVRANDSNISRRRQKADKLTTEVQQLSKLCQVESNRCWQLEEQLCRRPDSAFNDPLIASVRYDNMNFMRSILRLQAYIRSMRN